MGRQQVKNSIDFLKPELEGLIARALWEGYEYTLPVSPATMAKAVIAYLDEKEFFKAVASE
jgi:hypothetical protein